MKTTNVNGKKYRSYSPDEFFSSPEGEHQKYFDLDKAKTRYNNLAGQKKKTSSETIDKN